MKTNTSKTSDHQLTEHTVQLESHTNTQEYNDSLYLTEKQIRSKEQLALENAGHYNQEDSFSWSANHYTTSKR